jgi:hypothetical protein
MRLAAALTLLCGCTSPPCALHRLDDAPDAAPGEVRHGFAIGDRVDVAATATGIACLTCGAIHYFDGALSEQRRVGVDLAGSATLAVADDTTFVLARDFGQDPDLTGGDRQPRVQLFALSATGQELWRNELGDGEAWSRGGTPAILAGPMSVVVHGEPLASVFRPTDGSLLWTTPLAHGDALAADGAGGLFVALGASALGPAMPQATLRHVRVDGTSWMTTWGTTNPPPYSGGEIAFADAEPDPDGGFVVAGEFTTATLDLYDQILRASDPYQGPFGVDRTTFVASVGGAGGTQWAAIVGRSGAAGRIHIRRIAAVSGGVVICGDYAGTGQLGLPATDTAIDAFVARVDASGAITAHAIGGDGEQICEALVVGADGSATIVVQSDHTGPGELHVGSQTFEERLQGQFYILQLAL